MVNRKELFEQIENDKLALIERKEKEIKNNNAKLNKATEKLYEKIRKISKPYKDIENRIKQVISKTYKEIEINREKKRIFEINESFKDNDVIRTINLLVNEKYTKYTVKEKPQLNNGVSIIIVSKEYPNEKYYFAVYRKEIIGFLYAQLPRHRGDYADFESRIFNQKKDFTGYRGFKEYVEKINQYQLTNGQKQEIKKYVKKVMDSGGFKYA